MSLFKQPLNEKNQRLFPTMKAPTCNIPFQCSKFVKHITGGFFSSLSTVLPSPASSDNSEFVQ